MAKGTLRNSKNYARETKINIDISTDTLSLFWYYSLRLDCDYITVKSLRNIKKLFDIVDIEAYEDRPDDEATVLAVKFIMNERIENNVNSLEVILQKFSDDEVVSQYDSFITVIENTIDGEEDIITDEEVKYINKFVEQRLTYYNIFKARDTLSPLFKQLDSKNISLESIGYSYSTAIESAFSENMKVKTELEESIDDFDLFDNDRSDYILDKTIDELNKPNNHIRSGIKMLNNMLNGGFENGRFYLLTGVPKSFKSGTLLNIALWAIKYNTDFVLKNPSKRPCVLYLSQENSVRETIDRMYVNLTGNSISDLSKKEAKRLLDKELRKYNVNLLIRYRPSKSINTLDFDNMIAEIEATTDNEIIMAIQDYTKRIRSSNYNPEMRFELANIADDFCNIAKKRNIPVISGAQLNRQAYMEAEKALSKGDKDAAKNLNPSQIGESVGLIENSDYVFLIDKQTLYETSESYLAFKLFANRGKEAEVTYFAQKFENGMKLEEDVDLAESLSVMSIGKEIKESFNPEKARKKIDRRNKVVSPTASSRKKTKTTKKIINSEESDIIEFDEDDDE